MGKRSVWDRKGAWTMMLTETKGDIHACSTDSWEVIDSMDRLAGGKHILQRKEGKNPYNVFLYRVLPYPPHTKEVNDFFIQRS
jgi:hypothetical protein